MFRRWALDWLRADLTEYTWSANSKWPDVRHQSAVMRSVQQSLAHWKRDADLASVRDHPALDGLPEDERAAWQALWREVDELLTRVAKQDELTQGRKEPETPKAKPEGRSLPPSGATGR